MSLTIVDFGSRSIKLYAAEAVDTLLGLKVQLKNTINWNPLEVDESVRVKSINLHFKLLADILTSISTPIYAIGTAFARRNPDMDAITRNFCKTVGIQYETISQDRECDLIRRAFGDVGQSYDIFNVGGGSIQICGVNKSNTLLGFGISDLNNQFCLNSSPESRKISECIEWVAQQLPDTLQTFIYSGGEATFLKAMAVALGVNNQCPKYEFETMALKLNAMKSEDLESVSPFGAGWMTGAIASNCIVLAALKIAKADFFIASDRNVADGLITSFAAGAKA